jgi:hypothetical protein
VSLVLDAAGGPGGRLPVVVHWGPDLGPGLDGEILAKALVPAVAHTAVDRPVRRRLLPMPADGWRLRPGLSGARPDGEGWSPRFLVGSVELAPDRSWVTHSILGRMRRVDVPRLEPALGAETDMAATDSPTPNTGTASQRTPTSSLEWGGRAGAPR